MSEPEALYVLLAPAGQLCGNGQLRESIYERRARRGEDYPMWYLTPELVQKFNLYENSNYEAVIAKDSSAIAWLKLRFGGERTTTQIDIDELWKHASSPPEPDLRRDIGLKKNKQN
ncbi:hypothetical protein [Prochlorococcus sp. MIT 1223]|uniref:hypothetical protein n=1 Tax=Prochlorococcus sp. MIT 1223 TaxID=3096217 RepID=UPI002A750981|nr:hypothetical protein [Prochlorococcus sp. MIT 1223]